MKILILGASGMAGHIISTYLGEKGHDVTNFVRKDSSKGKNIVGDATDFLKLKNIIIEGEYDAVINAIGILNSAAEENKSNAVLINSFLPHYLSDITKKLHTKVIQMSTDCVFSGKEGNYYEYSFKDGETFYDRTKALGEIDNHKDLTFRNSIIGPDLNIHGIGLFNWFMKQNGRVDGYSSVIWTGVTTLTLAKAIEEALKVNLTGLYHLVNNEVINKAHLLELFNKHMKNNEIIISSNDKIKLNKSLYNNRSDFEFKVPSYEVMIIEMKEWIINHPDLYPHYEIKGDIK